MMCHKPQIFECKPKHVVIYFVQVYFIYKWNRVQDSRSAGFGLKRKICDKNLFSVKGELCFKMLWKMIFADVDANVKQEKIK